MGTRYLVPIFLAVLGVGATGCEQAFDKGAKPSSRPNVAIDGFREIKFDMNPQTVTAILTKVCSGKITGSKPKLGLFGTSYPAYSAKNCYDGEISRVRAAFDPKSNINSHDARIQWIDVDFNVNIRPTNQLNSAYRQAFGAPYRDREYRDAWNHLVDWYPGFAVRVRANPSEFRATYFPKWNSKRQGMLTKEQAKDIERQKRIDASKTPVKVK